MSLFYLPYLLNVQEITDKVSKMINVDWIFFSFTVFLQHCVHITCFIFDVFEKQSTNMHLRTLSIYINGHSLSVCPMQLLSARSRPTLASKVLSETS